MRSLVLRAQFLLAVLVLASPLAARAEPSGNQAGGVVSLQFPSCAAAPYDAGQLIRVLAVELTHHRLRPEAQADAPPDAVARVELRVSSCDGRGDHVSLAIWDQRQRLVARRSVALEGVPDAARSRTLALVISEALHPPALSGLNPVPAEPAAPPSRTAARADTLSPEPPSWAAAGPEPVPDLPLFETDDPYGTPSRLRLGVAGQARLLTRQSNLLLGVEAGAHGPLVVGTQWAVEVGYSGGETWSNGADLDIAWWNAGVGVDALAAQVPSVSIGPRLALAHVSSPADPISGGPPQAALLALLGARAGFSVPVGERSLLELMLEGHRILSVVDDARSEGQNHLPESGWMLAWGMGVAFQP